MQKNRCLLELTMVTAYSVAARFSSRRPAESDASAATLVGGNGGTSMAKKSCGPLRTGRK
ncbi:MAG: hypothetical protein IJ418_11290 [Clostridia bacterium]|nr:hypothetical protein [Clostridia bacterium]